jgi:hypothetical protein
MIVQLIFDTDDLYRRFPDDHIRPDGSLSSAAFQNTSNTDDMSVNLAKLTTLEETISGFPDFGVASFLAGLARELDQQVLHDPIPDNGAHSIVRGKKSKRIKKRLALGSTIILLPSK